MTSNDHSLRHLRAAAWGTLAALVVWFAFAAVSTVRSLDVAPIPDVDPIAAPRPKHDDSRPTVAVLMSQAGTEVTDFLAPYAIFAASEHFNVYALAPTASVAPTNGGLGIRPHMTLAEFDVTHHGGADLVVIPNVLDPESAALTSWVTRQAQRGAVVASICEGARMLAHTGLLDGREATTHVAALGSLRRARPEVRWREDVRFIDAGPVVTSAGVTASIDVSLHLVERLAGIEAREQAQTRLGIPPLEAIAVEAPSLSLTNVLPGLGNAMFAWPKQELHVPLFDEIDELELAAVLDTYSRTFAASTVTTNDERRAVQSRHGLVLVPMRAAATSGNGRSLVEVGDVEDEGFAFDRALRDVGERFGGATAQLVADQIEYPAWHLQLSAVPNPMAPRLGVFFLVAFAGAVCGRGLSALRR